MSARRAARGWGLVCALMLMAGPQGTVAAGPGNAPIVVDWLLDEVDATLVDGVCFSTPGAHCTLRAAVQQANNNAGADTIVLGSGYYVLNLVGDDSTSVNGDLDVNSDLTLRGAGMDNTIIVMDGIATNDRVLHVLEGVVRLEDLALTGGRGDSGGAIINYGVLTLDHTRVFSNAAIHDYAGGAISNFGGLTLLHSVIEYNTAFYHGGGLYNTETAWIEDSTIAHNAALGTIGGGIYNSGDLILINSTLSGNFSLDGGSALHNDSSASTNAYNITIALNIHNGDQDGSDTHDAGVVNNGGTLNLRNSLVARNYELIGFQRYYKDCDGLLGIYGNVYFMPLGFNPPPSGVPPCTYGGTGSAYISMHASDILTLGNYGGPTPTHDITTDSPAYDGGDAVNGCLGPYELLATDQRGMPRIFGAACDAGAVEHGSVWRLFTPLLRR